MGGGFESAGQEVGGFDRRWILRVFQMGDGRRRRDRRVGRDHFGGLVLDRRIASAPLRFDRNREKVNHHVHSIVATMGKSSARNYSEPDQGVKIRDAQQCITGSRPIGSASENKIARY